VSRRIDDDVLAPGGVEEAPRGINRDALGLFVLSASTGRRIQTQHCSACDLLQLALRQ
jgi:hypothetical protein